jgi:RNA polymerase sigma-70 factor (sigma-E family)
MTSVRDAEFEAAFDRLLGRAYAHARRLVGDPSLAEDLAAEALARTYARWPKVRSYEYLDAWVLRVVTNLAIDTVGRRPLPSSEPATVESEDLAVLRVTLAAALRTLPARQRDAVVLRYLLDMSETDVARSLGVAPGTVKSHLHRAVERLQRALGPGLDPRFEEA